MKVKIILNEPNYFRFISVSAIIIAILIANRWVLTPLGFESFGRIWHLFINYQDFGLVKRALEGSALKVFGISGIFENPYKFAFFYHSLKLIILGIFFHLLLHKNKVKNKLLFYAMFFSPAFLLHYGYETGSLDITLAFLTLSIFYFNINNVSFVVALCAGVLLHELYILFIPSIVILMLYHERKIPQTHLDLFYSIFKFSAAPVVVFTILLYNSYSPPSITWYEEIISQYLGPAVNKHPFWSGYFELFSSVEKNISTTNSIKNLSFDYLSPALVPVIYMAILLRLLYLIYSSQGKSKSSILTASAVLPMSAFYFATDFYRFISYVGTIAIIGIAIAWNDNFISSLEIRYIIIMLAICTILGPFGNYPIENPFPLFRFFLDYIN